MDITDKFTKILLAAIVLLLTTIACRQSGPVSARAADNVEYLINAFKPKPQETFLELSAEVNNIAEQYKGRLFSLSDLGLGTAYIAVFEVPKGTVARLQNPQKK
jgi:hypothetical protein